MLAYALLTALCYRYGELYSDGWRVPLRYATACLTPLIDIDRITLDVLGRQRVFRLQGRTHVDVQLPDGVLPRGTAGEATTLQAHAHLHLIVIGSLLLAWPADTARRRSQLLLAVIPAVMLATLLDIPFVFAGLTTPDGGSVGLQLYYRFLQQGGRVILAVSLAAACILLCAADQRTSPAR